jgi:hypothetical protein
MSDYNVSPRTPHRARPVTDLARRTNAAPAPRKAFVSPFAILRTHLSRLPVQLRFGRLRMPVLLRLINVWPIAWK